MSAARKPWPMRWIVASILLFIVPYTYVNLKFRKPDKAFEPYADMKDQANVKRLLDAGYTRVAIRAERPYPALPAPRLLPAGVSPAGIAPAPGGLPKPLDTTLVEPPACPPPTRTCSRSPRSPRASPFASSSPPVSTATTSSSPAPRSTSARTAS